MNRISRICRVRSHRLDHSLKEGEMKTARFRGVVMVGAVLGLLTGLLFSVGVPSAAEDCTWCLVQHTGYFNLTAGNTLRIWPGTRGVRDRWALVTVTVMKLNPGMGPGALPGGMVAGAPPAVGPSITVFWEDEEGQQSMKGINQWNNSVTVYAKWVEVKGRGEGFYTITFNLCG